jgi:hypothetical protein
MLCQLEKGSKVPLFALASYAAAGRVQGSGFRGFGQNTKHKTQNTKHKKQNIKHKSRNLNRPRPRNRKKCNGVEDEYEPKDELNPNFEIPNPKSKNHFIDIFKCTLYF